MPVFSATILNDSPYRMSARADTVELCGFLPNFTPDAIAAARLLQKRYREGQEDSWVRSGPGH